VDPSPTSDPPTSPSDELGLYLVDAPEGPVGVLLDVRDDADGSPATLIVGQGWFARRKLQISSDSILGINHRSRRILLAAGAAPVERSRWLRFFG
jgi:hypothetical protein